MAEKRKDVPNAESLAAFYTGLTQNLSIVHSADDAIESKTAAFLAGSLVVITLTLSQLAVWRGTTYLGIALLLLCIAFSIYILWSRPYSNAAVKVKENLDYLNMKNRDLILHLIFDCEKAIDDSELILNRKAKIYPWILTLFIVGSTISILSLYVNIGKEPAWQMQRQNGHSQERPDPSRRITSLQSNKIDMVSKNTDMQ